MKRKEVQDKWKKKKEGERVAREVKWERKQGRKVWRKWTKMKETKSVKEVRDRMRKRKGKKCKGNRILITSYRILK